MRISTVALALLSCTATTQAFSIIPTTRSATFGTQLKYGGFDSEFETIQKDVKEANPIRVSDPTATYSGFGYAVIPPSVVGPGAAAEVEAVAAELRRTFGMPAAVQEEEEPEIEHEAPTPSFADHFTGRAAESTTPVRTGMGGYYVKKEPSLSRQAAAKAFTAEAERAAATSQDPGRAFTGFGHARQPPPKPTLFGGAETMTEQQQVPPRVVPVEVTPEVVVPEVVASEAIPEPKQQQQVTEKLAYPKQRGPMFSGFGHPITEQLVKYASFLESTFEKPKSPEAIEEEEGEPQDLVEVVAQVALEKVVQLRDGIFGWIKSSLKKK